jgi:hypothetical protein
MKKITLFLLLTLSIMACKKDASSPAGINILKDYDQSVVKVGQRISFYDSTAIRDSIDFVDPPGNHLYVYTVKPDDHSVSFGGDYQKGIGTMLFSHAGTYDISAEILDSATHKRVGGTRSLVITVSTDTLHDAQAIDRSDSLTFYGIATYKDGTGQPILELVMSTAKEYDYNQPYAGIDYKITPDAGGFSVLFSDSVRLYSYPYAPEGGIHSKVQEGILIPYSPGTTQQLKITWLDKTYSGTFTTDNNGKVRINWPGEVVSFLMTGN